MYLQFIRYLQFLQQPMYIVLYNQLLKQQAFKETHISHTLV